MNPDKSQGFTLIEVLVALLVLSLALLAGTRASEALIFNADHHQRQMAAQWCAQNALVGVRLQGKIPDIGKELATCEQGPYQFEVETSVWTTPNPNFRRVVAQAAQGKQTLASLSTIMGRY